MCKIKSTFFRFSNRSKFGIKGTTPLKNTIFCVKILTFRASHIFVRKIDKYALYFVHDYVQMKPLSYEKILRLHKMCEVLISKAKGMSKLSKI